MRRSALGLALMLGLLLPCPGASAQSTGRVPRIETQRRRIVDLATRQRLPVMFQQKEGLAAGGLISYGPSEADLYRRAADYADRILKGAKPGDLPFQQPTTFELVVNLKTARALGLTIPQSILLRADEVIQ